MGVQRRAFRMAILPAVGISLVSLLIGTVIGIVGQVIRDGPNVDWVTTGERLALLTVGVLIIFPPIILLYRVFVLPDGLRGYTAWGTYRTFHWAEFDRVRPVNLIGFRFLRLVSIRGGPAIWLPLFLADPGGFRAAVIEVAGEEHALSEALGPATDS